MPLTKINSSLAQALNRKRYVSLTPVQEAVLEIKNPDQDLLVSAQTGSGKTVAYGLTMAHTLLRSNLQFDFSRAPQALIVAPTRELALQVHQELCWLFEDTRAKIITCIGGMNVRKEASALERGTHIVVGTPGRLCDHVRRRHLDLSHLQVMVLDEADEMLDLGFRDELEELLSACSNEHRTLLFSATIDKEIESLARRYQKNALRINTVSSLQHRDIEYHATVSHPKEIDNTIINLIRYIDSPTAMVFCATRELVRHMQSTLIERGFSCVALSGDLGQDERNHAIKSLRTGQVKVCVATDVAARGLDLPMLDLVIHASLPTNPASLLHRSGRTGRAGRKGICALVVPNNQRHRAERLLAKAKITAVWENPPSVVSIREKDNQRLLNHPVLSNCKDVSAEDQELVKKLTEQFSLSELANAVVSLYRSTIPDPEEITTVALDNRRSSNVDREFRRDKKPFSKSFQGSSWFEIPIGRHNKADPKWLIPILCKVGNIQKSDIGDIRITDKVTKFEIAENKAADFTQNITNNKNEDIKIYSSSPEVGFQPRKPSKGYSNKSLGKEKGRIREKDREKTRGEFDKRKRKNVAGVAPLPKTSNGSSRKRRK